MSYTYNLFDPPELILQQAVISGDLGMVKTIISERPALAHALLNNACGMCFACAEGHLDIVKFFVEHGASINHTCEGWAPIFRPAQADQLKMAEWLLDHGADLEAKADGDCTPLYIACLSNSSKVTELFLNRGANPNAHCKDGKTPLMAAMFNNKGASLRCAQLIVNSKSFSDINAVCAIKTTALHYACTKHNVERIDSSVALADFLIKSGALVDFPASDDGTTPLMCACYCGSGKLYKAESRKLSPDDFSRYCGLPISVIQDKGLQTVIVKQEPELVKLLVKSGANVNAMRKDGWTPFYIASASGDIEILRFLIDSGANPDIVTPEKDRPIFMVCRFGHVEAFKLLLEKRVPITPMTPDGNTTLHLAARCGCIEIVQILISCGLDVNAKNAKGETPLFMACSNCHGDVITCLLENKADPNICKSDGYTPLMGLAQAGNTELAKYLISKGAKANVKAVNGQTAASLCDSDKVPELKMFLFMKSLFGAFSSSSASSSSTPSGRPATLTEGVIKCGFLWKTGKVFPAFKRRWFVLTADTIYYYKGPTDQKQQGQIDIAQIHQVDTTSYTARLPDRPSNTKDLWEIYVGNRVFSLVLDVNDTESAKSWIDAILAAKQALRV